MSNRQIVEHGAILESSAGAKSVPIRIIAEGKGSSATYTRQFLESNKDIFANRPMYLGHPDDVQQPWKRTPDNIAGRTGKVVEYKVGADGVAGLYTEATPRGKYKDLIEEFGDLFGVSVFAPSSNGAEDGEGNYIVESVDDSPLISVDFVAAAGAGGRIETLIESISAIEKPSVTSAQEKEKSKNMEDKLDKLIGLFESFIAKSEQGAQDKVQAKVDAEAKAQAVAEALESYDAKRKIVEDAELLPIQRDSLLEAAKRGDDIAPLVETAKKVLEQANEHVLSEGSVGREFTSTKDEDWTVGGIHF